MADSSWARFDVVFFRREWLEGTTPAMRLAWAELVLHVKAASPSQKKPNRATSLSARTCSRLWDIPQEEIESLIDLAIRCGELTVDGASWVVTELDPFVSEKTKRRNEADQDESDKSAKTEESDFADKSDKSGESGQIRQIGHSVYTEQDRTGQVSATDVAGGQPPAADDPPRPNTEPPEPPPKKSRAPDERFERLRLVIARCHDVMGYDPPTDADVRRELKPSGPTLSGLLAWLEELPPPRWAALAETIPDEFLGDWEPPRKDDAAVAMWVHARRTWRGAVSWPAVYAQRDALVAQFAGARTSGPDAAERADRVALEMDRRLAMMGGSGG